MALVTGVQRRVDVVCLQEPLKEKGGSGISHSAYEIRKRKRVSMAIRRGSSLVVNKRMDLSRVGNDDVIATDVRRREERITMIVNVYDQKDTQSGERPVRMLNRQRVIRKGGTVLDGDFNAQSSRWHPRCQVQRNATFWEDVIHENGLEMGYDGTVTHHWTREGHEGKSVFDLTLPNGPISKWSILADNHPTGTDHKVMQREVEADRQEEADHERLVGWKIAAMTEEDL